MNIAKTLAVVAFVAFTGCTQMSDADRAVLNDTRNMAMEAKNQAAMAAQSAAQSAAAAEAASQKCNRISRQPQRK